MTLAALIRKRETVTPANANPAKAANDGQEGGEPLAGLAALALANPTDAKTADAVTSWGWLLHFADREPLEVFTHPDAGMVRITREYPNAISAEPLPAPPRPTTSCATCAKSRKPGASRHCCARPELTPAYGEGHPLRQLPDDGGADCGRWVIRTREGPAMSARPPC